MQFSEQQARAMRDQRRIRWAQQQLGISPGANDAQERASFFAKLEAAAMVPSESLLPALRTLRAQRAGRELPPESAEFMLDDSRQIEADIEAFAAKIFHLPSEQRRKRWHELMLAADHHPRAVARLKSLARGLAIDTDGLAALDDPSRVLANQMLSLFPLQGAERASRRDEMVQWLVEQPLDWKKIAKRFRLVAPALAALDEPLLERLADRKADAAKIAAFHRQAAKNRPIVKKKSESEPRSYWLLIGLGLIVLAALGRFVTQFDSPQNSPARPRYNNSFSSSSDSEPAGGVLIRPRTQPAQSPPPNRLSPEQMQQILNDLRRRVPPGDSATAPPPQPSIPQPPIPQPNVPEPLIPQPMVPRPPVPTPLRPPDPDGRFGRPRGSSSLPNRPSSPSLPRGPSVPSPAPGFP